MMPRWLLYAVILFVVLSWIPLVFIARERATRRDVPRVQIIPDMDKQPKHRPLRPNPLFADGRSDRRPVEGTVARGGSDIEGPLHSGRDGGGWIGSIPVPVTEPLMRRGRERYDVFCAVCHGYAGEGDGIAGVRADRLQEGTWTPPSSLHDEVVRSRPDGHLFNTITNGIRNMPSYGSQIPELDRWAIVAYVRALQRSGRATLDDVPPGARPEMR